MEDHTRDHDPPHDPSPPLPITSTVEGGAWRNALHSPSRDGAIVTRMTDRSTASDGDGNGYHHGAVHEGDDEEEDDREDDEGSGHSSDDDDDGDDERTEKTSRDRQRCIRNSAYLRTEELEQLYSALFRRFLSRPSYEDAALDALDPLPADSHQFSSYSAASFVPSSSPSSSLRPLLRLPSPQHTTKTAKDTPELSHPAVPSQGQGSRVVQESSPRDREGKRLKMIEELVDSEELYLKRLQVIRDAYLPPLTERELISEREEQFLTVHASLFYNMHKEFYLLLLRRFRRYSTIDSRPSPPPVGDIFLTMTPYFETYRKFSRGHAAVLATLHRLDETNAAFRRCTRVHKSSFRRIDKQTLIHVLKRIEASEESRGFSLAELLIMPLQQICKYPRFLSELIEYTPEGVADREVLKEAEKQIVEVVRAANEEAARGANLERLKKIAGYFSKEIRVDIVLPSRNFIHEGPLAYFSDLADGEIEWRPAIVFLFSDMLLVADRVKNPKLLDPDRRSKRCFATHQRIYLRSARIINVVEGISSSSAPPPPRSSPKQPTEYHQEESKRWRSKRLTHHQHRFEIQALWRDAALGEERVLHRHLFAAHDEDGKRMWFSSIQKQINQAILRQINQLPPDEEEDESKPVTGPPLQAQSKGSGFVARMRTSSFRIKRSDRLQQHNTAPVEPVQRSTNTKAEEPPREPSVREHEKVVQGRPSTIEEELAVLREEIDQLRLTLHDLGIHLTSFPSERRPHAVLQASASSSPPASSPTSSASIKKRQRRSNSASS